MIGLVTDVVVDMFDGVVLATGGATIAASLGFGRRRLHKQLWTSV